MTTNKKGIAMWIARDKGTKGWIGFFVGNKPERTKNPISWAGQGRKAILLDKDFPEYTHITWEDEPVEVKIVPVDAVVYTPVFQEKVPVPSKPAEDPARQKNHVKCPLFNRCCNIVETPYKHEKDDTCQWKPSSTKCPLFNQPEESEKGVEG